MYLTREEDSDDSANGFEHASDYDVESIVKRGFAGYLVYRTFRSCSGTLKSFYK